MLVIKRGPPGSFLFRWERDWVRGGHLGLLLLWYRRLVGKRYWRHLALRSREDTRSIG